MPPARKSTGNTPQKPGAASAAAAAAAGASAAGSSSSSSAAASKKAAVPVQRNRLDNYFSKTPSSSAASTAAAASAPAPAAAKVPDTPKKPAVSAKADSPARRTPTRTSTAGSGKADAKPETVTAAAKKKDNVEVIDIMDESSDDEPINRPAARARATTAKKRALDDEDEDSDFEIEDVKPKAKVAKKSPQKASPAKAAPKPPAKAADKPAAKASTKAAAKPKAADKEHEPVGKNGAAAEEKTEAKPKPKWPFTGQRAGPANPGGKPIPEGKPNCLSGLTFVFTGDLDTIDREGALELVRRYGARVTSGPSSKTSYVVVGSNPGESKLAMIKKHKLPTLDEDGLFELISSKGSAPLTAEQKKKIKEDENKVKEAAKTLEKETAKVDPGALWTVKYAPRSVKDIVANKTQVEKLQRWLQAWPASVKCGFKKPGKDASGTYRAVLISGPPGIGKTTTAHLVAKLEGFDPIELNASDARSKKLVEMSLKDTLDNANLSNFLHGKPMNESMTGGIKFTPKTCLIMDEVDGMSGGDRGGVGAINALIKKTKIPIICICNDRRNKKMQPFERTCFSMPFRKPEAKSILARMMTIAFKEGIKIPGEVMNQLIEAAEGDLRLVINMLSTWKLSSNTMSFDEAKTFGAANAKPGIHTPFSLYSELAGPYMFSQTSRKTLNDKADFYFQDFSLMPLMVQENYAKQRPVLASREQNPKLRDFEAMRLTAKASMSISDGDVLDGMIHGGDQHWSLMPHHAIASCVRPCSYVYGQHSGHFPSFPSWLGQNSKAIRLRRGLIDLQARMRLATLGACSTKQELRQDYQPVLWQRLSEPMTEDQYEGVEEVIAMMDNYYLGIEDRDAILELGVGANDFEALGKKIPSTTKAAFTRKYNAGTHPMAFVKAFNISKAKPLKGAEMPDVEEAFEEDISDDEVLDGPADDDSDIEIDISKTKGIKKAKAKPVKGKGKAKS